MLEQIKEWDQQLLLFLNQFHTDWLDPVVLLVTRTDFWLPLYAFLIFLIFKNYKKEGWLVLVGVAVTILLADRITAGVMKPYFHRLRPSNEPGLQGILHLVDNYRGGLYGFASSHAANTTGVALFCFLLFRDKYKWIGLLFLWAFVMTYTRIYLGVHYPGDIITGAAVGLLSGYAGYHSYRWLTTKVQKKSPVPEGKEI
ncbi:MAG: phosphatase PAP2 family protein [Cyclobacteriaceae bacterium]|nr:phosphatase PAP2 family protein [Cyclobacteriaceae bacterium]